MAGDDQFHTLSDADVVAPWPTAGPTVVLGRIDFVTWREASVHRTADLEVDGTDAVGTVAVSFGAHLSGDFEHSAHRHRRLAGGPATAEDEARHRECRPAHGIPSVPGAP